MIILALKTKPHLEGFNVRNHIGEIFKGFDITASKEDRAINALKAILRILDEKYQCKPMKAALVCMIDNKIYCAVFETTDPNYNPSNLMKQKDIIVMILNDKVIADALQLINVIFLGELGEWQLLEYK